jgi:hypothetical protein
VLRILNLKPSPPTKLEGTTKSRKAGDVVIAVEFATSVNVVKFPFASESCRKKVFPELKDAMGAKLKFTLYVANEPLAHAN